MTRHATLMEENTNFCDTDTLPIPVLDVESKTLPVFCPCIRYKARSSKSETPSSDHDIHHG